jgi:hypothetical protein
MYTTYEGMYQIIHSRWKKLFQSAFKNFNKIRHSLAETMLKTTVISSRNGAVSPALCKLFHNINLLKDTFNV